MKKILLIFTGGTIACTRKSGILDTDEKQKYKILEDYIKKFGETAEFDCISPYTVLSENLCAENLMALKKTVLQSVNNYDGIIITHGTDTLQYSSSFISLVVSKSSIPIMFVSSNLPLENQNSNGFFNFCGAVDFILKGQGKGVFIAYKNEGENVKFYRPENVSDYDPFCNKLRLLPINKQDRDILKCEKLSENSSVLFIKPYVGMAYPPLDGIKAVVLQTFHSGTLKSDDGKLKLFLQNAERNNIKVVITGISADKNYKSEVDLKQFKNVEYSMFSPIYTYMKTWILTENPLKT
ncbi:MAG: asparaginase [Clostridia bacterium]|nr:asparaginase [Clostridia bacterium]